MSFTCGEKSTGRCTRWPFPFNPAICAWCEREGHRQLQRTACEPCAPVIFSEEDRRLGREKHLGNGESHV